MIKLCVYQVTFYVITFLFILEKTYTRFTWELAKKVLVRTYPTILCQFLIKRNLFFFSY
ncbi:hypothetical protein BD770DRAFT_396481 [Pilaira anomala]|nr:hypothetical protein BD770DRAFT_396481 [Pilaira anomala]